ncbi:hypothetical protein T439DRAFT_345234, partial [Meredithblackwellia eburnea MCA 4105]
MADESHRSLVASKPPSVAETAVSFRRTTGTIPPPLVGSTVTLIGNTIYVFGGRIVHSRSITSDLYALDLKTLAWEQQWPTPPHNSAIASNSGSDAKLPTEPATPDMPSPPPSPTSSISTIAASPIGRYFHSASAWGNKLVVFGGQTSDEDEPDLAEDDNLNRAHSPRPLRLRTLNDILVWDCDAREWELVKPSSWEDKVVAPGPRFAHLATVASVLVDHEDPFNKSIHRVSRLVLMGGQNDRGEYLTDMAVLDLERMCWIEYAEGQKKVGTYRSAAAAPSVLVGKVPGWPHSVEATLKDPLMVWLLPNTSAVGAKRDLDRLQPSFSHPPTPSTQHPPRELYGPFPPPLRFPHATTFGPHLVVSGLHRSSKDKDCAFHFWSVDTRSFQWSKIDTGTSFARGSWHYSVGWKNSLVVLGARDRDLIADYNQRRMNFSHISFIALDQHGICQPPLQQLPPLLQKLGYEMLLNPALSDFEIVSTDGVRLGCSQLLLSRRWSWFSVEMDKFRRKVRSIQAGLDRREDEALASVPSSPTTTPSPTSDRHSSSQTQSLCSESTLSGFSLGQRSRRRILAISPRTLEVPIDTHATKALLYYFYTLTLPPPGSVTVDTLCSILRFSINSSGLENLSALVTHALQTMLERDTSIAVQVFETATLTNLVALQIRSIQVMSFQFRTPGGLVGLGIDTLQLSPFPPDNGMGYVHSPSTSLVSPPLPVPRYAPHESPFPKVPIPASTSSSPTSNFSTRDSVTPTLSFFSSPDSSMQSPISSIKSSPETKSPAIALSHRRPSLPSPSVTTHQQESPTLKTSRSFLQPKVKKPTSHTKHAGEQEEGYKAPTVVPPSQVKVKEMTKAWEQSRAVQGDGSKRASKPLPARPPPSPPSPTLAMPHRKSSSAQTSSASTDLVAQNVSKPQRYSSLMDQSEMETVAESLTPPRAVRRSPSTPALHAYAHTSSVTDILQGVQPGDFIATHQQMVMRIKGRRASVGGKSGLGFQLKT